MAIPRVIYGLAKKRAQLVAELAHPQGRTDYCRAGIAALDAALLLWDAGKDAPELRTQHRVNPKLFKYGYIARLVADTLREAGQPLTVGQICEVLIERHGLVMVDPRSSRRLNHCVSTAITEKREQGVVRAGGKAGRWIRWELAPVDAKYFLNES